MDDYRLRAEDLKVGELLQLGQYWVSRQEIVTFAEQWDPLPFHVDETFARSTRFGDVIGSGLHTMAIFQRLAVLNLYRDWALIAGRALRNVRLTSPLRPDTAVRATIRIDEITPDTPERAVVCATGTVLHDDLVLMTLEVESYVLRRA